MICVAQNGAQTAILSWVREETGRIQWFVHDIALQPQRTVLLTRCRFGLRHCHAVVAVIIIIIILSSIHG